MSPLPVAGCRSTIGVPCPPVSQYQSWLPGTGAMPSLAGACVGIGIGVIGLVWLRAVPTSDVKPSPRNKAHSSQATLRVIAFLPSLDLIGAIIPAGTWAAKVA